MGKKSKYVLVIAVALIIIGIFFAFGPPNLLARSSEPDFCSGCHVMEAQFEAWAHAGAHRNLRCVDCHLPNQNMVVHYIWKSIDGVKDAVVFYSGNVPDRIQLSEHGNEVLQENCIRCHQTTVAMIDQMRSCWQCHRSVQHLQSAPWQTL